MNLILIYKILTIVISAFGLFLGLWVYFSNRKRKINCIFFIVIISNILLIILSQQADITTSPVFSLFSNRLTFGVVSIYFVAAYFFSKSFIKQNKKYSIDGVIVCSGIVFTYFSIFSTLIVKNIEKRSWGFEIVKGGLMNLYLIWLIILMFVIFLLLFKKYFKLEKENKLNILYFLIGTCLFAVFNLLFNILPLLFYNTYKYHMIGDLSAIFFLGFTAFAILKQNLFGVKVLLTELLVGVMGIILFILPFFIPVLWIKIILSIVFIIFCFIGYSLIKYTRRGERQNEFLEKKVKERTKKLQERANELEKFYKMTIGRELKMRELKGKIEELEKDK